MLPTRQCVDVIFSPAMWKRMEACKHKRLKATLEIQSFLQTDSAIILTRCRRKHKQNEPDFCKKYPNGIYLEFLHAKRTKTIAWHHWENCSQLPIHVALLKASATNVKRKLVFVWLLLRGTNVDN